MTLLGLMWAKPRVDVPKVGDDPHAQQVIAEITEWGTTVNWSPVRGKSPVVPERGRCHTGHRKTRLRPIPHGSAGRRRKNAVGQDLLVRGVRLEVADDIDHLDPPGVRRAREETLIQHEGDDGNE